MTSRKYSAIVFDLGQVLIPFDYKPFIDSLNHIKDGLGESFAKIYKQNYHIHRDFEKGKIPEEKFIEIMLEWTEGKLTAQQFCVLWSKIFSLNEDVISLLSLLKINYKLYLLSNTNSIHKRYGYQHYEFLKIFDKLYLSHEVGFIKPEKEIYNYIEKDSGKSANELILIDDIKEYVDAAKSSGWDGIVFTGYENLKNELSIRNIKY
jgi:putative hydrolase of the HAD superfamily